MQKATGPRPLIMIVEDHPLIVEFVAARLHNEGFEVVAAEGCGEALALLATHQPDLLIVDVVLDDGLGYDLCRTIRQGGQDGALLHLADIPILILTARADEQDRLAGFDAGADDYVVKPFSPDELVRRIQAILRRSNGQSGLLLEVGPLRIDPRRREVWAGAHAVDLTPKEFDLLQLLACNPGRVFSREELLERVWGYSFLGNTRTVDVHVNRLRQKLADADGCADLIGTEWGIGYKLLVPEQERAVGA
jgi:DNA-binding response OmpR family regulator